MIKLKTPLKEKDIRKLKIGDRVIINGIIFTARDMAHKFLVETDPPKFRQILNRGILYHCGPIVRKKGNSHEIIAAGPTTSIREEPYEAWVIERFKIKAIIGKGGMGDSTLGACKKHKCVYLSAVGGAAQVLAQSVSKVLNVYKLKEFGVPEAIWELEVKDFPAIVTMDSKGGDLHKKIMEFSGKRLDK